MHGIFGWSYPPGCSSVPGDEVVQCEVCGGFDIDPRHATPYRPACVCHECSVCGMIGDPNCYKHFDDGGHGMVLTDVQKKQAADILEQQRLDDESEAESRRHDETWYDERYYEQI